MAAAIEKQISEEVDEIYFSAWKKWKDRVQGLIAAHGVVAVRAVFAWQFLSALDTVADVFEDLFDV